MKILSIRHAGIVVKQIEPALQFYRDWLGLHVYWNKIEDDQVLATVLGFPNLSVNTIKLSIDPEGKGGTTIELLHFLNPLSGDYKKIGLFRTGCTHIALQVSDLDSLYKKLVQRDVRFISSPQITSNGNVKLAFCEAPENIFLELVEINTIN
jgi:catechol 2,3-dioxygenase-like lactoylglutathione lyase family enzyme